MLCGNRDLSVTDIHNDLDKYLLKFKLTGCFGDMSIENIEMFSLFNPLNAIMKVGSNYLQVRIVKDNDSYHLRFDTSNPDLRIFSLNRMVRTHKKDGYFLSEDIPSDVEMFLSIKQLGKHIESSNIHGFKYACLIDKELNLHSAAVNNARFYDIFVGDKEKKLYDFYMRVVFDKVQIHHIIIKN